MNNIIGINQMIDYIDDFISNGKSQDTCIVGGMVGTNLCKLVIESASSQYNINEMCIIEGCQDYIGFDKTPLMNHMYYGDMFYDMICGPLNGEMFDAFKPKLFNPPLSHNIGLNMSMINCYKCMVLNDAHLIPEYFLLQITSNYPGKIIMVVDPFDIGGEKYSAVYKVTDTLDRLPMMMSFARAAYDIDTRFIDKKYKGSIKEGNITKRSIGKIDDKQYISNDDTLCELIQTKQLQSKFRKYQKMFVTSNKVNIRIDTDSNKRVSLPYGSMITIHSATTAGLYMKYRLYSSKIMLNDIDTSYIYNPNSNAILVKPANILNINESRLHRYKHTVLVIDDEQPISVRQKYSILKNSLELTIGYIKR